MSARQKDVALSQSAGPGDTRTGVMDYGQYDTTLRRPRQARPSIRLDMRYVLPDPFRSDEDARRQVHEDLVGMDRDALTDELWRLRFVLSFGDLDHAPPWAPAWIRERARRIKALLRGTS